MACLLSAYDLFTLLAIVYTTLLTVPALRRSIYLAGVHLDFDGGGF